MSRNKILLATTIFTVAAILVATTPTSYAYWGVGSDSNFVSSLATKLGISQEKVTDALTSIRADRQQEREASYETRLSQLVTDGKITADQKTAILAKHKEIQTKMQALLTTKLTVQERHDAQEKLHDEMTQWAKDNNIDIQYVLGGGYMMGGRMGGRMHGGMMGMER